MNCIIECFENGEMSNSRKQTSYAIIEKKGKDRSRSLLETGVQSPSLM